MGDQLVRTDNEIQAIADRLQAASVLTNKYKQHKERVDDGVFAITFFSATTILASAGTGLLGYMYFRIRGDRIQTRLEQRITEAQATLVNQGHTTELSLEGKITDALAMLDAMREQVSSNEVKNREDTNIVMERLASQHCDTIRIVVRLEKRQGHLFYIAGLGLGA